MPSRSLPRFLRCLCALALLAAPANATQQSSDPRPDQQMYAAGIILSQCVPVPDRPLPPHPENFIIERIHLALHPLIRRYRYGDEGKKSSTEVRGELVVQFEGHEGSEPSGTLALWRATPQPPYWYQRMCGAFRFLDTHADLLATSKLYPTVVMTTQEAEGLERFLEVKASESKGLLEFGAVDVRDFRADETYGSLIARVLKSKQAQFLDGWHTVVKIALDGNADGGRSTFSWAPTTPPPPGTVAQAAAVASVGTSTPHTPDPAAAPPAAVAQAPTVAPVGTPTPRAPDPATPPPATSTAPGANALTANSGLRQPVIVYLQRDLGLAENDDLAPMLHTDDGCDKFYKLNSGQIYIGVCPDIKDRVLSVGNNLFMRVQGQEWTINSQNLYLSPYLRITSLDGQELSAPQNPPVAVSTLLATGLSFPAQPHEGREMPLKCGYVFKPRIADLLRAPSFVAVRQGNCQPTISKVPPEVLKKKGAETIGCINSGGIEAAKGEVFCVTENTPAVLRLPGWPDIPLPIPENDPGHDIAHQLRADWIVPQPAAQWPFKVTRLQYCRDKDKTMCWPADGLPVGDTIPSLADAGYLINDEPLPQYLRAYYEPNRDKGKWGGLLPFDDWVTIGDTDKRPEAAQGLPALKVDIQGFNLAKPPGGLGTLIYLWSDDQCAGDNPSQYDKTKKYAPPLYARVRSDGAALTECIAATRAPGDAQMTLAFGEIKIVDPTEPVDAVIVSPGIRFTDNALDRAVTGALSQWLDRIKGQPPKPVELIVISAKGDADIVFRGNDVYDTPRLDKTIERMKNLPFVNAKSNTGRELDAVDVQTSGMPLRRILLIADASYDSPAVRVISYWITLHHPVDILTSGSCELWDKLRQEIGTGQLTCFKMSSSRATANEQVLKQLTELGGGG